MPEDAKGACTENDVCSAEGLCYCSNQRFLGPSGRIAFPAGLTPYSLKTLDLNGDGRPDLATANSDEDTVSVLLNQSDGAFAPRSPTPRARAPLRSRRWT